MGRPPKEVMDVLLTNEPIQNFSTNLEGFMRSWEVLNGDDEVDTQTASTYTKDFYTRSRHAVGVVWNHIQSQEKYIDLSDQLFNIKVGGMFIHGDKDPLIPCQAGVQHKN
ncbi:MAG: hypothetical protein AAF770_00790 [Bacteroidota bacterium]